MSVYDYDVVERARVVRERLARLRAHQTEMRQRLHAAALQDLLEAGYSLAEAGKLLDLSRTFVHRAASSPPEPAEEDPEFEAIDEAVERYVLG